MMNHRDTRDIGIELQSRRRTRADQAEEKYSVRFARNFAALAGHDVFAASI